MPFRIRPKLWLMLVSAAVVGVLAASAVEAWGGDARLRRLERSLDSVTEVAAKVDRTVAGLKTSDDTSAAQVATLGTSLDELRSAIDSLRSDLSALKSSDATMQKKIDDLSAKMGAIDQRLWVLEARYNDHLRKYHNGG